MSSLADTTYADPSAVCVHNENSDDIWSIYTYSLTCGLYAMHVRWYILLAYICDVYACQNLQHIWSMTFYWIFWLFGTSDKRTYPIFFRHLVRPNYMQNN